MLQVLFFKNLDGFACTYASILTSVRSQIGRHGLIEFKTSVIKLKTWGEIGSRQSLNWFESYDVEYA